MFFKRLLLITLLINFLLINAQDISLKSGKASTKGYYTELIYKEVNSKMIIPVTINNKTYQFLFDTGAPNLISESLKKEFDINNSNDVKVRDANNNRNTLEIVNLPPIVLGNVTFNGTSALVFNFEQSFVFKCLNIDGIIGSNVFRKSIVKILPKEHKIVISDRLNKIKPNKAFKSKLTIVGNQGSPYIDIKLVGNKTGNESVLFDTGMNGLYDLAINHFNIFKEESILRTIDEGQGSSSLGLFGGAEDLTQYRAVVSILKVGKTTFNNVSLETTQDSNSRIGAKILDYGNVTLDFKHKRFYFEPFNQTNNLNEKHFGFSPTIVDEKFVIGTIWDEDLKGKLEIGDEIISINHLNFQDIDPCSLIKEKPIPDSAETINLVTKNKTGKIEEITLTKAYLSN